MKILFLDDDELRRDNFLAFCNKKGLSVEFAVDANEAFRAILKKSYDFVCLDHDLCPEHYQSYLREAMGEIVQYGGDMTGKDLIDIMEEARIKPGKAIIHSFNKFGAERMYDHLVSLGWEVQILPFGSQEFYQQCEDWS